MSELKIRKFPDPVLKKRTAKVYSVGPSEKKLLLDMAEAMYLNNGVGLAANQVGVDKQIAVIDIGGGLLKMINPSIVKSEGSESEEEGCLSVPEAHVKVRRARRITVDFVDENGDAVQLKAGGLLARAIQHEVDHLSGRLIIDYLHPIKRLFLKRRGSP